MDKNKPESLTQHDHLANQSRDVEDAFLAFCEKLTFEPDTCDRWIAIAKTHAEEGGMALRKAIFNGKTTLDKRERKERTNLDYVLDRKNELEGRLVYIEGVTLTMRFKNLPGIEKRMYVTEKEAIIKYLEIVSQQVEYLVAQKYV